jgi:outer membrane protein
MLKKTVLAGVALLSFSAFALADSKIGAINIQKILADAPQAARAKKKIEKDFEVRDQELQRIAKQLKTMQENLDKNAVTMAETERRAKEREFGDLSRASSQRKRREFREDLSQRQNEEMASNLRSASTRSIKQLAEAEKYDIIFQEAVVYVNPRIDITDKVIKALGDGGK